MDGGNAMTANLLPGQRRTVAVHAMLAMKLGDKHTAAIVHDVRVGPGIRSLLAEIHVTLADMHRLMALRGAMQLECDGFTLVRVEPLGSITAQGDMVSRRVRLLVRDEC